MTTHIHIPTPPAHTHTHPHPHTHTHTPQIDPEALTVLITQCSTPVKAKTGRWANKGPSAAPTEPSKQPASSSTAVAPVQSPVYTMYNISSDESESDSSFIPNSNSSDSEDEAGTHRPGSKSKARGTGLSPKPLSLEGEATASTSCSSGEKDSQPGTEKSSGDAKDGKREDVVPPGWTGAEVTYFRMLHPVFGHNYCSIAELIRTKSCQVRSVRCRC